VAFCYFFVFGQVFAFIQGFAPKSITAAPDIEAYLSFVLTMFLAFGLALQVPIVVVVLRAWASSAFRTQGVRGYFVVLAFIIAAIVTPPDVVSQLALAVRWCCCTNWACGQPAFHQAYPGTRRGRRSRRQS